MNDSNDYMRALHSRDPHELARLAQLFDASVRVRVMGNPNTSIADLEAGLTDANAAVSANALTTLCEQCPEAADDVLAVVMPRVRHHIAADWPLRAAVAEWHQDPEIVQELFEMGDFGIRLLILNRADCADFKLILEHAAALPVQASGNLKDANEPLREIAALRLANMRRPP